MKSFLSLTLVILMTGLVSCKKEKIITTATVQALAGKWQLVSDANNSSNVGYNGTSSESFYHGTTADYFEFGTNGMAISHEKGGQDTAHYSLTNNEVQFFYDQAGNPGHYYYTGGALAISNFTSHTITLTSGDQTPGGYFGRVVVLKR